METITAKAAARLEALHRGEALTPTAWRLIGWQMAQRLYAHPAWQQADTVFCFVSMTREPDTVALLQASLDAGKRVCLPRVVPGPEHRMEPVVIDRLTALAPGHLGVPEPAQGVPLTVRDLGPRALTVVPCVAAARNGVRLGHGGGYYDRFLAQFVGRKVLLCPSAVLFDTLPADTHDVPFAADEILTEQGFVSECRTR